MEFTNEIAESIEEGIKAALQMRDKKVATFIESLARLIAHTYSSDKKILICGNGGSLCDAMHFAEELTGLFRKPRPAIGAIALSDPGHMSCVGNDLGFEKVYSRAVEALGKKGDLLIVLTTSGNSLNIIEALHTAKGQGLKTVSFLGKTGGKAAGLADLEWIVKDFTYSDRIQELHMMAIHIVIEMVELILFENLLEEEKKEELAVE